jgi:arylsulfatase A-like enzyme
VGALVPVNPFTYTLWLIGPLALGAVVTKAHKLLALGAGPGPVLAGVFPDLLVIGLMAIASWLALHPIGWGRWLLRPLLHLLVFAATLLVFVDHGFWLTTGTLLDPAVLRYGLTHMDALGDVYLSAMGPLVWVGLAVLVLIQLLPLRYGHREPPTRARAFALVTTSALFTTGLASLITSPPRPALGQSVLIAHLGELLPSAANARPSSHAGFLPVVMERGQRALDGLPANVIFIVMESVRARSTTPYEPSLTTTPFLAKLAARGALVEDTWTTVTHTSKALVSALCGIHPMLDLPVVEAKALPTDCLARVLRERGYATAFMQPAAGGFEERRDLITHMGYETFVSRESIPPGQHELTNYFGYEDEALLEPALAFTAAHKASNRPFFLTLLNLSTHHTYDTPSDHVRQHDTAEYASEYGKYLDSIGYFDNVLERLFEGLERQGVLGRTLVVLVGDHGEAFGEHGTWQHNAAIHEEGLHVPLVLVGPGIVPGTRIGGLRQLIDLVPTTFEWLGTPVKSGLPGKSLLSGEGHAALFASCWLARECLAVREGEQKLIWYYGRQAPQLYDLASDPLEERDLLSGTPDRVWRPMLERLLAWEERELGLWRAFLASRPRDFVSDSRPEVVLSRDVLFRDHEGRPLVRLIGVDAPRRVVSGQPIALTLHWQVLSELPNWYPFTYLVGPGPSSRVFDANHPVAGGRHPVRSWRVGTFVSDRFEVRADPSLEPGAWSLAVGFFTSATTGVGARAQAEATSPAVVDAERRGRVFDLTVSAPSRARRE